MHLDIYPMVSHKVLEECSLLFYFIFWIILIWTMRLCSGHTFPKNSSTIQTSYTTGLLHLLFWHHKWRMWSYVDFEHPSSFSFFAETFGHGKWTWLIHIYVLLFFNGYSNLYPWL
jgi:hypothetical protein